LKAPVIYFTGVLYATAKMKMELNIHPGIILKKEFLEKLHISSRTLSIETGITKSNMNQISKGKRDITAHISYP